MERKYHLGVDQIMKRTISLLLAILTLTAALAGCTQQPSGNGGKQLTAEERTDLYKTAIESARDDETNEYNPVITELGENDEYLLQLLGVAAEDMSAYGLSVSLMNVQAYGIAAVYPAEGKADAVLEGLQGFIDLQRQNFEQYLPDQYEIAQNAKLETLDDGTILLVMCEDQDTVFNTIRDAIEKAD